MRLLGVRCNSLINGEDFKRQQIMAYMRNPKKIKNEDMEEEKNSVDHVKGLMRN